ncbi:MAG: hypothetical protein MZV65_40425 [Chromatiales bacterium]|nr:hypothetical protein [Chromatiales bacterium]
MKHNQPSQQGWIEDSLTTLGARAFVSVVTLVEIVWVLEGCYNCIKDKTSGDSGAVAAGETINRFQDSEVAWQAVRLFKTSKAGFADCLIERIAGANQCEHTVTFDKTAARTTGMRLLSTHAAQQCSRFNRYQAQDDRQGAGGN